MLDAKSTETVTIDHIRDAREQMILARETHLDALAYRLEDPQIRKVMETMMIGEPDTRLASGEAFRICLDLGLVSIERGSPVVANPIYREVLAREVTFGTQMAIPEPEWKWEKPDGTLDMDALLKEFQKFWRKNSEAWEDQADYKEAFPHLLVMAFLQRVANGEGRIEREYAAGRGRMDLAVEYKGAWNIIEIKLLRKSSTFEKVKEEGIEQILRYRERIDPAAPCYLIIFDRRPKKPGWAKRLIWDGRDAGRSKAGDRVTVVGC
ncbi:MAG: PD-(D/E)XK nuclease domain-containing protein [Treponema sp.]|nr:PD-(D/E)XK nuclease domain-containing protein [Treponema sp.]